MQVSLLHEQDEVTDIEIIIVSDLRRSFGEGVTQPWAGEVYRSHLSLYQLYDSSSRPNSRIHYNK